MIPYQFRRAVEAVVRAMFGNWASWTPTYGASGSMTFTSVTTNVGRYIQIGKTVHFELVATGTTGGVASTDITFTLPVAAASTLGVFAAASSDTGPGFAQQSTSTTVVAVQLDSLNIWSIGLVSFKVRGTYEVA